MIRAELTNNINRPIIDTLICYKIQRGLFMGGSVRSDRGPLCPCGSKFIKREKRGYPVPICPDCGSYPKKLYVRRYVPNLSGKGVSVDIRWNEWGERLENIHDAIDVLKSIDKEILNKTFDPRKYLSRADADQLKFKTFINNKYLPSQEKKMLRGEIKSGTLKKKRGYYKNHLLSFFGEMDTRNINSGIIQEYFDSWAQKLRTRDLVIEELDYCLKYAELLGVINKAPKRPKTKAAKIRNVENFLSLEDQQKIIENIENPTYKAMVKVLAIYAMRPCEVRALKWCDLDFKEGIIKIQRHFENGTVLVEGRKSNSKIHYLPMTESFRDALKEIPLSIVQNDFVFRGMNGGAVGDRVLSRAWHKAREKASVSYVQLYEGTKHSRLSQLKGAGYSDQELILLSGHTNIQTVKRYAQINKSQKVSKLRGMIE